MNSHFIFFVQAMFFMEHRTMVAIVVFSFAKGMRCLLSLLDVVVLVITLMINSEGKGLIDNFTCTHIRIFIMFSLDA